jgi:ubiquinone/menaquinone biosynthesis C-methylase UbiE
MDYASTHPNASVTLMDEPCFILNTVREVENYQVKAIENLNQPFLEELQDNSQDFVRVTKLGGRMLTWENLLSQVYRILKPKGYLELCDSSKKFSAPPHSEWRIASSMYYYSRYIGQSYNTVADPGVDNTLRNAGFQVVRRASSGLTFDTHNGSKYAESVLSELEILYMTRVDTVASYARWAEIRDRLCADSATAGVTL